MSKNIRIPRQKENDIHMVRDGYSQKMPEWLAKEFDDTRFQDVDLKNNARKNIKNTYATKQRKKKISRRRR
jgi:hypothetical protein